MVGVSYTIPRLMLIGNVSHNDSFVLLPFGKKSLF